MPCGPVPAASRPLRVVIGGTVVVAALSLLLPWALAFDPQAWVVWGRDAGRLALDTRGGPSWKPLPVLVTTPLAFTGDPTPALWLLVARTGGLLALAGAWALGQRVGGRAAGAVAAAVMALSPWWLFNTALGNSEGLLAAALLWAVLAHLDGHRRTALALATAAALLRPEVWPFLGLYGLWLWRGHRRARAAVAAVAIVVPTLWLGPDLLGVGGALSASRAARGEPSLGSAALEDVPALAVLADAVVLLTVPASLAALLATITGPPLARVLAAGAVAWTATVAVMAQAGYAGNPRYLVAAMAFGCVLAGVGAARLATAAWTVPSRLPAASAAGAGSRRPAVRAAGAWARWPAVRVAGAGTAVVLAVALVTADDLRDQASDIGARADRRAALPELVAAAGGRDAIVGCARVRTAPDVRPLVAWELDIDMLGIDRPPEPPAAVVRWEPHAGGPIEPDLPDRGRGLRLLARAPYWEAWCWRNH
jgi:hypothetical protein